VFLQWVTLQTSARVQVFKWCVLLKNQVIPIIGHGGLYGCEMLRIPYCLDNRQTFGSEVVSLMHWPRSIPQIFYIEILDNQELY
jgi:hypothetical protein